MRFATAIFLLAALTTFAQQRPPDFFLARTSGKLPMLAVGEGEDRLGGTKFGFLDTGVLLKVIDSTKDLFRVQLCASRHAYINKSELIKDSSSFLKPFYLTGSISVKGDEKFDYVNISLPEKLPYISWTEVGPSKIEIEIFGMQTNTNWIGQLKSAKEIKNVVVEQLEDDVVRITIGLRNVQHWGYSISYKQHTLSVRVRRQPNALRLRHLSIAVDAGHGGTNSGTEGVSSKALEKNYTLRFANELEKRLKGKGAKVFMTRTFDTTFNNVDRILLLQKLMPEIVISLHLNSSGNENIRGVSTYYKHIGFKSLSSALLDRMLQLDLAEFGNIGNFNFALNAPTDFPAALIEIAFLSNAEDEKKILDSKFQKAVAKKIYKGIRDWLRSIRKSA
jgi:N-acetylmuramoyl-L-alanine amidase